MLEFVLMLPFIWIVLVLILDFGQGFLERQRTMVAVREVAIRTAQGAGGDVFGDVSRETFTARRMTATFAEDEGGTCGRQEGFDAGPIDNALEPGGGWDVVRGALSSALGRVSRTRTYHVTAQGPPVAGRLLDARPYRGCFAIDNGTWTFSETGTLGDMLINFLRSVF